MFQNLRVSVRLGLGFGALMALLLILAGYGIVQMARINGHLREIDEAVAMPFCLLFILRRCSR